MNITILMSAPYPPQEGIGFYCTNLAKELTKQNHNVTLITRGNTRTTKQQTPDGYTIIKARYLPTYPLHVHLHGKLIQPLINQLESQTDVFHLHSPLVPVIKTKKPIITTVHTPMKPDVRALELVGATAYLAKAQAPISIQLEHTLFKQSTILTTVASSVAHELAEYNINPESVHVLGNATDATYFTPASTPPEPNTLLYAGRLAHRKGLLDLLNALEIAIKQNPKLHLTLAGNGPLEAELKNRTNQKNLNNHISFLGHINTREALRDIYQQHSIYIQPSHYEGLPTSLIEAMSCAKPVIATNVSGHLDIIQHNHNGLLVKPKQPEHLARTILTLTQNPEQAQHLAQNARQTILNNYTWPTLTKNYLNLYRNTP